MKKKKIYFGIIIISIIMIVAGIVLSVVQKKDFSLTNEEIKTYKLNEQASLKNVNLTLKNTSEFRDYEKCDYENEEFILVDSDCLDIKDNIKIIKLTFEMKSLHNNQLINTKNFKCIADNQEYNQLYGFDEKEFSYKLMSGESASGAIYCQVPKDAQTIKIKYFSSNILKAIFEI